VVSFVSLERFKGGILFELRLFLILSAAATLSLGVDALVPEFIWVLYLEVDFGVLLSFLISGVFD